VDTPAPWELNIWYHTLNSGMRASISGETDFPCIYDERVGMGRSYAKLDALTFDDFAQKIKDGQNYVSDGKSHIVDFRVEDAAPGNNRSELRLDAGKTVRVSAKVAAYLPEVQDEVGKYIAGRAATEQPYWDIERARVGESRNVNVELIVNGYPVALKTIEANGDFVSVEFEHEVQFSSWFALRIYQTSHTNPVFVIVDGKPVRASKRSAEWCALMYQRAAAEAVSE
jgi:hypothetical protein